MGGQAPEPLPRDALERLRQGNRRFISGRADRARAAGAFRADLVHVQEPVAVILGCSDSRVSPEIVFDQSLGDLFVVRVAGNIVEPSVVGSVEYAVEVLGTRLVVVLGHTRCGALRATLDEIERPSPERSPNLGVIIDSIRPSVEPLLESGEAADLDTALRLAMRANVSASAEQLRSGSAVLARAVAEDGLVVVGAEYSLESGSVEFFDDVPVPGEPESGP